LAEISKAGIPSLATVGPDPGACKHPTLLAGESIAAGDACYVKSDGLVWRSTGAAATAPAKVRGFAPTKANTGEPITLVYNVVLNYGSGLTPGADYYLSGATVGGLADAASTGGTAPVGFAIDATRVFVRQSMY
jgi:hypothetical protein